MDRLAILMAVRNGAAFLPDQLQSIAAQTLADWRLVVSDDGSDDGSAEVIRAFAAGRRAGQVTLLAGPRAGAAANFRFLLRHHAATGGGALAFADQDDVWHPDHLARAAARIGATTTPLLYGCRLAYCDASLRQTGLSPLPRRPAGFRNALVQNIFSGNGMAMNTPAAAILAAAEAEAGDSGAILLHDWWAYQILSGAGAVMAFDPAPGVLYRQHGGNVVGSNAGLSALPRRLWRHLRGAHGRWYRQNLTALLRSEHRLTPDNRRALHAFAAALDAPPLRRLAPLRASGVYHQGTGARAAFWFSALTGLI